MAAAPLLRYWTPRCLFLLLLAIAPITAVERSTQDVLAEAVDLPEATTTVSNGIGEEPSIAGALASILFATLLVVGLMVALALLYKRYGRRLQAGGATRHLEVVESLPVGLKRSVSLIRCADRVLVIGQSEQGLQRLSELPLSALAEATPADAAVAPTAEPDDAPTANDADPVDGFKQRLQSLRGETV